MDRGRTLLGGNTGNGGDLSPECLACGREFSVCGYVVTPTRALHLHTRLPEGRLVHSASLISLLATVCFLPPAAGALQLVRPIIPPAVC